jgi:SAM-dependent methyltransferase
VVFPPSWRRTGRTSSSRNGVHESWQCTKFVAAATQGNDCASDGQAVKRDEAIIEEINTLWSSVYPYMAEHLLEISGIQEGEVLDLGPFAGGIGLSLLTGETGFRASVIDESPDVLRWVVAQAQQAGTEAFIRTVQAPLEPIPASDNSFNLVVVRGAFFFLTPFLLQEVKRVLRPAGFAWVGGGYGAGTPGSVIAPIAEHSKFLNEAIGKRRVSVPEVEELIAIAGLQDSARISTDGGLWIELRS